MSQQSDSTIHQRVEVRFDYDVVFTDGFLRPDNRALAACLRRAGAGTSHRVLAVVDAGVAAAFPDLQDRLRAYAAAHAAHMTLVDCVTVAGGEAIKQDPTHVDALRGLLHRHRMDRHAFVLAIGGGAVLDAVGYAAATTHRGVRLVRVPTTVLAQNDAGLGVKNGINAFGQKNFIGTFAPPHAVLCDAHFLSTLSPRDLRAGIAEAIKVALIRDAAFFDALERDAAALRDFAPDAMARMIRGAAEHHLAHIAGGGDPFELGSARPLDFGHWAAHKLELLSEHRLRHGEAVAIGMALDCCYAVEVGMLPERACARVLSLLRTLGFALWDGALAATDAEGAPAVLAGLAEFREHLGGALSIPMLTAIGRATELHEVDLDALGAALSRLGRAAREHATSGESQPCGSGMGST